MFFYFYFQKHTSWLNMSPKQWTQFSVLWYFAYSPLPSYEGIIYFLGAGGGGEARVTYLYIFSFFRQIRQVQCIKWNKWKARKPSKNSFNYNLLIAPLPVTKQIFVFIDTFSLGLSTQFFSSFAHQKEYFSFCFNKSLWDYYRCWLLNMLCWQRDISGIAVTCLSLQPLGA